MVKVKKSSASSGVPSLDILAAKLRIVDAELTLEEKEVKLDDGRSFMSEPNLNCRIEVVKNLVEPVMHEGATFFDRFKLKKDENGEWVFAKYSKLGNLIVIRYGEEWFEDDAEFDEEDFEEFEFIGSVRPKVDAKGNPLKGSTIDWESMRPATAEKQMRQQAEEAEKKLEEAE